MNALLLMFAVTEPWNAPSFWAVHIACCATAPGQCAGENMQARFDIDFDCDVDLVDLAQFQRDPTRDRRLYR